MASHSKFGPISRGLATLIVVSGATFAAIAQDAQEGDATSGLTTADGVFAAEQVEDAGAVYERYCASCHGNNLGGSAFAPPLSGFPFTSYWSGQTLGALDAILRTMPADNPGSLSDAQYSDLLAFILDANGYPAGEEPLTSETDLEAITISEPAE